MARAAVVTGRAAAGRPPSLRPGRLVAEQATGAVLLAVLAWRLRVAQQGLWENGFQPADPFVAPRPGADLVRGGQDLVLVALLGVALCVAGALWAIRSDRWTGRAARLVALAVPSAIAVGLFLAPPSLSIDAYSYLSHGYLAQGAGTNPYVDPSASVAATPYGALLGAAGWAPVHPQTPYGPLWTGIERLAVALSGDDVALGIRLIKLPGLLALFATAALIGDLLKRTRPELRMRGVLLFLAGPLVLVEFAGDGHNDALMVCFVVLCLWACVRRWPALALVALALAVLVKATPLALLPPVLAYLILHRRSGRRIAIGLAAGSAVAAALAVALIAPYWVGAATFDGLAASGAPRPSWSVSGLLVALCGGDPAHSAGTVQLVLAGLLAAGSIASCFLVRSTRGLFRACAGVALLAFVLLPVEWPWYAALPLAILPLVPDAAGVAAVVVLAVGSRLVAGFGDAATLGVVGYDAFDTVQALLGQTVPGLAALALLASGVIADHRAPRAVDPARPVVLS